MSRGAAPRAALVSSVAGALAALAWSLQASAAAPVAPLGPAPLGADAAASPVAPPPSAGDDSPIELDGVQLHGETRGARGPLDPGRSRLEGLLLLSAADGLGGGGQVRSGMFGLRGTLTYQPLLFLVDADPGDKTFGAYKFSNSFQLNFDALLVGTESETGGSVGYRYNDLLGHGVSVAYQSMFEAWGQRFSMSLPVTYYPNASSRVRDALGIASDYEINFPFGAGLQFGVGAAWVL